MTTYPKEAFEAVARWWRLRMPGGAQGLPPEAFRGFPPVEAAALDFMTARLRERLVTKMTPTKMSTFEALLIAKLIAKQEELIVKKGLSSRHLDLIVDYDPQWTLAEAIKEAELPNLGKALPWKSGTYFRDGKVLAKAGEGADRVQIWPEGLAYTREAFEAAATWWTYRLPGAPPNPTAVPGEQVEEKSVFTLAASRQLQLAKLITPAMRELFTKVLAGMLVLAQQEANEKGWNENFLDQDPAGTRDVRGPLLVEAARLAGLPDLSGSETFLATMLFRAGTITARLPRHAAFHQIWPVRT